MMKLALEFLIIFLVACGVKGRPQPPLNPPMIGRGEPNFLKATERVKLQKKKTQKNSSPADDWNESDDFLPSEEN